ncbi:Rpn family recombination-promoting nuclease/putative transposase [Wolbachia endosymbiont of Psylliodes chrysocephala]|uniref:Rpn family recombination-promoting nuclease/putative transposase n=1 Tax=Wolbachia endosymbiont of Psylliodes chrysocephala TaxID=2883236 RepID=UPI0020A13E2E|nr:Rpn family recombination-promoting nuclease/putative transposase [Wolbachia endosymbiont of Psylliodes chrysocephala]
MAFSKFLDPKNDFAFRRIFGTEKNKDILVHFLNDILGLTGEAEIKDVKFLSPIQNPEIAAKKESIVDVLCRDSTGVQFICEMQVARTTGFEKRAQYYAAKAYSSQAGVGDRYHELKEVIFIAITDFILFPHKSAYKSDHVTLDKVTFEHDLKDFSFTFIELPKFKKKEDQLENIVEKWCYFFRYANQTSEEDLKKIVGSDIIIGRAYNELNQYNWSEEERFTYDQAKKREDDNLSCLKQKLNEGIQIGREKGRIEGKIEVAKTMLANNVDVDTIVKCTGLSISEIEELRNVLKEYLNDKI